MWNELGFKENPYSTKPLQAAEEDIDLLIGRNDESIDFSTMLESASNGVVIISGVPGVGKTSFLNVQQYLLERKKLGFGPKVIAARQLCPVQANDTPRDVALRALTSLIRSIEHYCSIFQQPIPKNVDTIRNWLNQKKGSNGFTIGISILGFGGEIGRDITLPSVSDITFENLIDILNSIVQECLKELEATNLIIVFDNIENLEEDQLGEMLMTFRDTLFSIPNLYWVLIGQSGLASLIQTLDQRVFQRLTSDLELKPISVEELKIAIDKRIQKFHKTGIGKSPVSENIYRKLYECSNGEIRFVFKYCSAICIAFAQSIRKRMYANKDTKEDATLTQVLGEHMINNEFEDELSEYYLMSIVQKEFEGLNLKPKDKEILNEIGKRKQARAKDFKEFSVKSMQDFSSNYLGRLAEQGLLVRRQEGRAVIYELRGLSLLAKQYGLLSS